MAASAALDAGRYDQIYALDEDCGFRAAILLRARGWKGRLVCLVHHLSPARKKVVTILRNAPFSHFFVYTHPQRAALLAAGVPEHQVTCAPIPADTSFFVPAPPWPGRSRVIAVGAAERDYTTLFRAAPFIDADIEIFGHGYAGADAAGIGEGKLPSNVRLMPHVAASELRDHLAAARAAILPLKPVAFAAGATVLTESMSSGVPVVATRIAGIESYLDAARPGPDVPAGDAEALAKAVSMLLRDESLAQAIGRANRRWVLDYAQIEDFAATVVSALSGRPVPEKQWRETGYPDE